MKNYHHIHSSGKQSPTLICALGRGPGARGDSSLPREESTDGDLSFQQPIQVNLGSNKDQSSTEIPAGLQAFLVQVFMMGG